jgi:hypothetical protein
MLKSRCLHTATLPAKLSTASHFFCAAMTEREAPARASRRAGVGVGGESKVRWRRAMVAVDYRFEVLDQAVGENNLPIGRCQLAYLCTNALS